MPFTITAPSTQKRLKSIRNLIAGQLPMQTMRIAAGEKAPFDAGVKVEMGDDGPLIPMDVTLSLRYPNPAPLGVTNTFKPVKVRTCGSPNDSEDCGKYRLTIFTQVGTKTTTPPGTYDFVVVADCPGCDIKSADIEIFRVIVEKPKFTITVSKDTPDTRSIFAGDDAEYSIDVRRENYLGPIEIGIDKSTPNTITLLPLRIESNKEPDGVNEGITFTVMTMKPDPEKTFGTPAGKYSLRPVVNVPFEKTFKADELTLNVQIRPDIGVAFDRKTDTQKVEVGKTVVLKVLLFFYNTAAPVKLSVKGQPPSKIQPKFSDGPIASEQIPTGLMQTYTLTVDVPLDAEAKLYELTVFADFMIDGVPLQRKTETRANIIVKLAKGTVTLKNNDKDNVEEIGQTGKADFFIGIARKKSLDNLEFFTKLIAGPAGQPGAELPLMRVYDPPNPVQNSVNQVMLTVKTNNSVAGTYDFEVGARASGADMVLNTVPFKLIVTDRQEVRLRIDNPTREIMAGPGNKPVYPIKVKRLNFTAKPLPLSLEGKLPKLLSPPTFEKEVTTPGQPESTIKLVLDLAADAAEDTYNFRVVAALPPGVITNDLPLTLKIK